MILPSFFKNIFSQKNPYEKIMDSISKVREEHQANKTLGFVSDQIKISKKDDYFDINHCLIMENGQTMTMTYTLDVSDEEFLPSQFCKDLKTYNEVIIKQNRW